MFQPIPHGAAGHEFRNISVSVKPEIDLLQLTRATVSGRSLRTISPRPTAPSCEWGDEESDKRHGLERR